MVSEQRTPEETLQESKVAALESSGTMSGPLVGAAAGTRRRRRTEAMQLILRMLCMATSLVALSLMVTAKESSSVSIYGFLLPIHSKWSFSESYEYLVGVSVAVAAHSLLQFLIGTSRFLRMSSVIPSRNHAWLIFAGDQAFAYALMSAGSAASGVTNLNRTGIRHTALPNFCKPLHKFCDHVAISIAFTFFSCFLLATSAVQDVIWLSQH
ncbi:CASP-like protein 3A1 [Abrus precatorius]|uniref:CASP-like protein n=1 Tax=Abrus precatorius TaxID=3816 RepID=A0A8B8KLC9_ABRPR|nr:CASP-like protein 3A1 [Abrus precatorius]